MAKAKNKVTENSDEMSMASTHAAPIVAGVDRNVTFATVTGDLMAKYPSELKGYQVGDAVDSRLIESLRNDSVVAGGEADNASAARARAASSVKTADKVVKNAKASDSDEDEEADAE